MLELACRAVPALLLSCTAADAQQPFTKNPAAPESKYMSEVSTLLVVFIKNSYYWMTKK